jgi:hypothetical protein
MLKLGGSYSPANTVRLKSHVTRGSPSGPQRHMLGVLRGPGGARNDFLGGQSEGPSGRVFLEVQRAAILLPTRYL